MDNAKKKRLDRWLKIGSLYATARWVLLGMIGAYLLMQALLDRWIHGWVALAAFAGGLALAYFPRLLVWRIRKAYADWQGEQEQPQVVFIVPQQANLAQAKFEQDLLEETKRLEREWRDKRRSGGDS
ncbi:MAG: hypothetical protein GTO63_12025 [Anaerolineae bacterium]|nr:hypothetical protein [Anaerolineae bacterium]NIN95623.1 hypothetical protein [Anaerolineae bacterium]NIQ78581.1 hypothetical protein [Anaerolineae bacterium]